jgi:hypothetical protein
VHVRKSLRLSVRYSTIMKSNGDSAVHCFISVPDLSKDTYVACYHHILYLYTSNSISHFFKFVPLIKLSVCTLLYAFLLSVRNRSHSFLCYQILDIFFALKDQITQTHLTISRISWSWSYSCGRQSVDQFIWVSGLPLGPLTRFYLALLFLADKYLILLSKA